MARMTRPAARARPQRIGRGPQAVVHQVEPAAQRLHLGQQAGQGALRQVEGRGAAEGLGRGLGLAGDGVEAVVRRGDPGQRCAWGATVGPRLSGERGPGTPRSHAEEPCHPSATEPAA
jgi:hypothetical protein